MSTSPTPFRVRTFLAALLAACSPATQPGPVQAPEAPSESMAGAPPPGEAAVISPRSSGSSRSAPRDAAAKAPAQAGLPSACHADGDVCLPPPDFVDRLCRAAHVGTAIRLFAKSSPFTRAYVRMREVRAMNLRGGPASEAPLTFAEEVLLLARHGGGSGELQVSGVGGYDVLRWDGTCATLSSEELALRVPARPRHAVFPWKYIDETIQEALLRNEAIRAARDAERKRCRGTSGGAASAPCREAAQRLSDHVVVAIRGGMDLPQPEYTP